MIKKTKNEIFLEFSKLKPNGFSIREMQLYLNKFKQTFIVYVGVTQTMTIFGFISFIILSTEFPK